jgi:hypothetical protein
MKPKEFDDLVRRKFEEGGFEYNARSWDSLAENLEGRNEKRRIFFWWMPVISMAASVAFAVGVPIALKEGSGLQKANDNAVSSVMPAPAARNEAVLTASVSTQNTGKSIVPKDEVLPVATGNTQDDELTDANTEKETHTRASVKVAATRQQFAATVADEPLNADSVLAKKKKIIEAHGYYTFKQDDKKIAAPKMAIILSGGLNYGNQTSGYIIGATARRMINDKVYVEGDVAFIGSSNTQNILYAEKGTSTAVNINPSMLARGITSKNSTDDASKPTSTGGAPEVIKSGIRQYSLYYAQVTPTIGYKIMKRVSLGVGPDFQQILVDNRPAPSTVDRGTLKENPMFDIGFMGKTEVAVSNNIKAAVYYREGINNIITPTNKFIDRNYVQFQIKCTIFNK